MMRLPHKSRLKLEFWSNSFVHLYALRPPYSNPYLSKCFSFLTLSDILHFLFFFDVLDLTEELFDKVGPAPFKMSYYSCLVDKFLSQKFLPLFYQRKFTISRIWIIAFRWIAFLKEQVKVGCATLCLDFSFEENLYIQSNRVGNQLIMCSVHIRHERKCESSVT